MKLELLLVLACVEVIYAGSESATEPEWLKQLKTKVPQPPQCGADVQYRIFGGTVTNLGEFPWAVLLEYDKREFAFVLQSA
jgi:uncharacterized phage protein gp47/JayE